MATNVIAVVNQKGVVGKTTTCANLGIGLAQNGKKVLLVNADAQGSPDRQFGLFPAGSRALTPEMYKADSTCKGLW